MQGRTASSTGELAALRARAYGPHADIAGDPSALARLRELEVAERAERGGGETATIAEGELPAERPAAEAVAASDATPSAPDAAAALELPGVDDADSPPAPLVRAHRPIAVGWIVAWAASILVVALVVGGMVFGLASIRPVSTETGATQVASLTEAVDGPEWLRQWFPQGADELAFRYHGLIVARMPGGMYAGGADSQCLFVADEEAYNEADQSFTGQIFQGCGVGAFPATVQFVIDTTSTEQLRDVFPDGTALQFVLVGDTVGVFAIDPPTPTPTPNV